MNTLSFAQYQQARVSHWEEVARSTERSTRWGSAHYQRRICEIFRFLVPPGQRVLEIGCAQGDLLASLSPALGVGIDFSAEMIRQARSRHPGLEFLCTDAHKFDLSQTFDVIILSDVLNDVWDVQTVFEQIRKVCTPRTRLIINTYSRVWQFPLAIAERSGLARPKLAQNWLVIKDIANLLNLTDFEVIRTWQDILCPFPIPLAEKLLDHFLVKMFPLNLFALTNFIIARVKPKPFTGENNPSVSVVIPARNEAGNIPSLFEQMPRIGAFTELVFVEGHSADNTYATIEQAIRENTGWRCKLIRQTGKGKGDAVRAGFSQASGDILMILDADLTVPAEYLPRFYEVVVTGKGDFANGVRLVYPMEHRAMRFCNLLGNKFFSAAFSWLLGQPIKDTLCGTKVFWKSDYELIAQNRSYFGDFDPFGDFDLIFGAAKLGLKIVDLPIRYRERTYGTTQISRWSHGWLLLRMVIFAAKRLKFV